MKKKPQKENKTKHSSYPLNSIERRKLKQQTNKKITFMSKVSHDMFKYHRANFTLKYRPD